MKTRVCTYWTVKKMEKINKKEAVGLIKVTIIVLISAFLNQLGCPETTLLCNLQLKLLMLRSSKSKSFF